MNRRVRVSLMGLVLLALTTGCGLLPGTGDEEPTNSPKPAKSTPAPTRPAEPENAVEATPDGQDDITATVDSVEANGQGMARVTYTLTNVGEADYTVGNELDDPDSFRTLSVQAANVQIIDEKGQERKYTLVDSERNCVCYWTQPGSDYFTLEPDDEAQFANMYALDDDVRTVTVEIPGFEPVKGVKVEHP